MNEPNVYAKFLWLTIHIWYYIAWTNDQMHAMVLHVRSGPVSVAILYYNVVAIRKTVTIACTSSICFNHPLSLTEQGFNKHRKVVSILIHVEMHVVHILHVANPISLTALQIFENIFSINKDSLTKRLNYYIWTSI